MWMIARSASLEDAVAAMHYVEPVGEKTLYIDQAMAAVAPYLPVPSARAA